jgi:hypothetical protein
MQRRAPHEPMRRSGGTCVDSKPDGMDSTGATGSGSGLGGVLYRGDEAGKRRDRRGREEESDRFPVDDPGVEMRENGTRAEGARAVGGAGRVRRLLVIPLFQGAAGAAAFPARRGGGRGEARCGEDEGEEEQDRKNAGEMRVHQVINVESGAGCQGALWWWIWGPA